MKARLRRLERRHPPAPGMTPGAAVVEAMSNDELTAAIALIRRKLAHDEAGTPLGEEDAAALGELARRLAPLMAEIAERGRAEAAARAGREAAQ